MSWHRHGDVYWYDHRVYRWGDDTADGPFTPAIPDDEPMEPGLLDQLDVMFSKATAQTLIEVTKERDDLALRLADNQAALAALVAQVRTARAQWVEDLKDAAAGLEKAVKSGYAQALADVSALCEARALQHEAAAKHGFAHEARELSRDVTKHLPRTKCAKG